jgi:hypothetical protein
MTNLQKTKTLQLIEKHPKFIKNQNDFLVFLEECIIKYPSFNALSEEVFWHFASNYPPHMFDAITFSMAEIANEIAALFFEGNQLELDTNIKTKLTELHQWRKNMK